MFSPVGLCTHKLYNHAMPLDQPPTNIEQRAHDARMSFGEHIEELRTRLILSLVGVGVCLVVTLYFGRSIVTILQRPLAQVQTSLGMAPQVYAFGPLTGFAVYVKVALVAAVLLASPWVCYQLWKFVESGLYVHERKAALYVVPFSAAMSVLGVLFLYFLLLPITLSFFLYFNRGFPPPDVGESGGLMQRLTGLTIRASGYGSGADEDEPVQIAPSNPGTPPLTLPMFEEDPAYLIEGQFWIKLPERELRAYIGGRVQRFLPFEVRSSVQTMLGLNEYINMVTMMAIGVALAFQLPVVMLILGWSGFVEPGWLARYRKYCVFVCFALGAIFTPADPVSMFVLALPLWGLFEVGLILMRVVVRQGESND